MPVGPQDASAAGLIADLSPAAGLGGLRRGNIAPRFLPKEPPSPGGHR